MVLMDGKKKDMKKQGEHYNIDYGKEVKMLTGIMILIVGIWQFLAFPTIATAVIYMVLCMFSTIVIVRETPFAKKSE